MAVYYKCYEFRHGRKCPDKNTDKCFHCKNCRAEMSADDATRLLNAYGRKVKDDDG